MKHAEICPVCKGSGKIRKIDGLILAVDSPGIKGEKEEICHGCNGKGWIEVGNDNWYFPINPIPYYPPYQPPYITYLTWSNSNTGL